MIHRVHIPHAPKGLEIVVARADRSQRGIPPDAMTALVETMLPGLTLTRGAKGEPIVNGGSGTHVSLSHAAGVTALAVAPFPVGIDIECVDPAFDLGEIDANLFGRQDFAFLQRQNDLVQRAHFYRLWTLKEARLKRDGRTLADAPLPDILSEQDLLERPLLEGPAGPDMATRWLVQSGSRYCVAACWAAD
jgi:phosphopantetheinyl transferase